jgi:apolipoprotein N-acyltransferase
LKIIIGIFVACISGILLFAAFPSYDYSILAWFALVPLFFVLASCKPLHAFFISVIFGVVLYTGIFWWMFDLPKYRLLHHAILGVYLTPLMGFFGLAFCLIAKRLGHASALFAAPFLWVAMEYARSNLSFLSLPWSILAHSQYQHPILIQIANLAGVHCVSFLIVLVNSAIAAAIYFFLLRLDILKQVKVERFSKKAGAALMGAGAFIFTSSLLYGYIMITKPIEGQRINISVVQGNIEQPKKWDPKYASSIMDTYADLTQKASLQKPDIIVWPETATPRSISENYGLYRQVSEIALKAGAPLLLGSSGRQKISEKKNSNPSDRKYLNSAFLIRSRGVKEKHQRYDKIRLLPFGEYMPMKDTISWSYFRIPEVKGFAPGAEHTIFRLPDFRFGVTICWENIFPDIVRQFVNNGAQFIVNLANEAWFGKTAAPYQFLSMSVFRAVENRIFVVRCVNTGISCFIDPCGRVIDRVRDKNNLDIFVSGVLTKPVVPLESKTFYSRYGDYFAWVCLLGTLIFLLQAVLWKHRLYCKSPNIDSC